MTQWASIGSYLGRDIQVAGCNYFNCTMPAQSLMDSLLLVVLGARFDDEASRRSYLSMLIGTTPLAIVLCGKDARFTFDTLIGLLSESSSTKHVMTKLLEEQTIDEALKDFFQATWPSEERFDVWKKYSVLVTGELQVPEIMKSIESISDDSLPQRQRASSIR